MAVLPNQALIKSAPNLQEILEKLLKTTIFQSARL